MTTNCISCGRPLLTGQTRLCTSCEPAFLNPANHIRLGAEFEEQLSALIDDAADKQVVWEGAQDIIPLAKVQYVYKNKENTHAWVIMDHTTYDHEVDCWNNAPYLVKEELADFIEAWKNYLK